MTLDTTPAVRPLYEIAEEIVGDWSNPSIHAQPYIEALQSLGSIDDTFWLDSARSVVVLCPALPCPALPCRPPIEATHHI
jgi:hypothetical protein